MMPLRVFVMPTRALGAVAAVVHAAVAACTHVAPSHSHDVATALPREIRRESTSASQFLTVAGARAVPLMLVYDVVSAQCRSPPAERSAAAPPPKETRAIGLLCRERSSERGGRVLGGVGRTGELLQSHAAHAAGRGGRKRA